MASGRLRWQPTDIIVRAALRRKGQVSVACAGGCNGVGCGGGSTARHDGPWRMSPGKDSRFLVAALLGMTGGVGVGIVDVR